MRYRIKPFGTLLLVLMCFCLLGSVAFAQSFSADVLWISDKQTMQGKIYVSAEKIRSETAGTVSIIRLDKKVVWLLMPTEKMYMEQAFRPQNSVPSSEPIPGEIERTFLGTESVNGVMSNKYRVSIKAENRVQAMFMWLMVDKDLPVKMSSDDGKWSVEYRNIQLGDPDPGLFEIPVGYKKFSMNMNFGQ